MLRFVTLLAATAVLASSAPSPANVFEIDISPEEAQQYLNSPPFSEPQLSGQTGTLPLVRWNEPRFRAAEAGPTLGHYWKNGKEIENTDDYVEEVYDAAQFHGQDGLGAFSYGYKAPESSKVENRARSGDVQGSYTYRAGNNDLIKVRYWADSEGFHQEDNIPKVELQPAQETEEVREARLAHEKAWQEAAAAAAQQPDPQGEYNSASASAQYQGAASEPQNAYASAPHSNQPYLSVAPHPQANQAGQGYQQQNLAVAASGPQAVVAPAPQGQARDGKAYASAQSSYQNVPQQQQYQKQQQQYQGQYQGQQAQQKPQYQGQQGQYQGQQAQYQGQQAQYQAAAHAQQGQGEEVEPTGPPRGFFYSYTYPVSIIVAKNAQGQQGGAVNPGQPIDHDTVGINAQAQAYAQRG